MIGTHSQPRLLRLAMPVVVGLALIVSPAVVSGEQLATAMVYSGGVQIDSRANYSQAVVTVSGGDVLVRRVFESGEPISVELYDLEGDLLPDGIYTWELELVPNAATARELRLAATENGGEAPNAWQRQSGTFAIRSGLVATPDLAEAGAPAERSAFDSGSQFNGGSPSFARTGIVEDDDAAVGSREGVEAEVNRAAAAATPPAVVGVIQAAPGQLERTDQGALAMGQSLEPMFRPAIPSTTNGQAKPEPRSISPDGKHGRPRSKDEVQ